MDHRILCLSCLGFLLPVLFYIFYRESSTICTFLAILIISNVIASIFFWKDALQHGFFHKIDAILARITFICGIGYILLSKTMTPIGWFLFGMILGNVGFHLYLSNEYSVKEWCCPEHIYYHFIFHLSIPAGFMFCFL